MVAPPLPLGLPRPRRAGVRGWPLVQALAVLVGCGPEPVLRPLELELDGLSGQAEVLTVKILDPEQAPGCGQIDASLALVLDAERTVTWRRSDGAPRELVLDGIGTRAIQIVAVATDAEGAPIQLGCAVYSFEALERPEQVLELELLGA